jgi:pimeloyl-ACP methyl ester carboxylesterase
MSVSEKVFRGSESVAASNKSVAVGGLKTNYWAAGRGVPMILVHGSGAGVSALVNWYANLDALGERFHVLAPDLVGFGDSDIGPDRDYGIAAWVEHLLGFLDALDIDRAHLVGNSLGGWISAEFARAHPARVRRLVLMGTGGTPESMTPRLRTHQKYEPSKENMRAVLRGFVCDERLVTDELIDYRFEMSGRPGAAETFSATAAARNRDRVEQPLSPARVADVRAETLLIHGRDDAVIPVESSWNLLQALPAAHLVVLSRCGHWSQIEQARRFNLLVADFAEHGISDAA